MLQMNVSKDASYLFLVYFTAKDCFRNAKNMVFSLFCILIDKQMGRVPGYAAETDSYSTILKTIRSTLRKK